MILYLITERVSREDLQKQYEKPDFHAMAKLYNEIVHTELFWESYQTHGNGD